MFGVSLRSNIWAFPRPLPDGVASEDGRAMHWGLVSFHLNRVYRAVYRIGEYEFPGAVDNALWDLVTLTLLIVRTQEQLVTRKRSEVPYRFDVVLWKQLYLHVDQTNECDFRGAKLEAKESLDFLMRWLDKANDKIAII